MHIKDIETRTGLSRANIRYYEQEGLVHPVRARNGYRDYSQEDLDTLLRVRLLRRLDVPIEEIRAMQAGELDLADVLEERIRIAQRREEQARRTRPYAGPCRRTGSAMTAWTRRNTGWPCTRRPRQLPPRPRQTGRSHVPGGGSWRGIWTWPCAPARRRWQCWQGTYRSASRGSPCSTP